MLLTLLDSELSQKEPSLGDFTHLPILEITQVKHTGVDPLGQILVRI